MYSLLQDVFFGKDFQTFFYTMNRLIWYSGIGQSYWQVLAGRAISGIGGAGMTALVSIIIAGKLANT